MVRIHPPSLTPSAPRIPASSARQDTTHRSRGSEVSAAATLSRPAAVGPGRRPARRAAPVSFSHAGRGLGGCSFPAPRSPWRLQFSSAEKPLATTARARSTSDANLVLEHHRAQCLLDGVIGGLDARVAHEDPPLPGRVACYFNSLSIRYAA